MKRDFAPYALPGVAGLLAIILATEFFVGAPGTANNTPSPPLPATAQAENDEVSQWSTDALARPLFSATRRPDAASGGDNSGLPRLSAIIIIGKNSVAVFSADGQKPQPVAVGGEIDGNKMLRIDSDQVELLGPSGPLILHPQFPPSAGTAAGSAPPPPAPSPNLTTGFNPMAPLPRATPTSNPALYIEQNF